MRSHLSGVLAVMAAVTWSLSTAVPAAPVEPMGPCALDRTRAHHSEGLTSWNDAYARPIGRVDAAMVFLAFPDAVPAYPTAELAADHVPDTRRFFSAASYGRFDFNLVPIPGYFPMPGPSTSYGIQRDWAPEDRRRYLEDAVAAADPAVDFGRYEVVFFVADPEAPGVDPDATKIVNLGSPIGADGERLAHIGTIFEAHPPDRYVFAHESAHTFDLPDLYKRPGDDDVGGDWNTEVGDWDLMGDQKGLAPDPFAWHKWKFGWLAPEQVGCLAGSGTLRRTLTPVEVPGGRKLLVVRTGRHSAYAVEVRGRYGNDSEVCREGVLVYRVRADVRSGDGPIRVVDANPAGSACEGEAVSPRLADAPFGVGEEFRDPETGTLISVVGAGPGGSYTVEATRAAG